MLLPVKVSRYRLKLGCVPADFFADPDGEWTYEELVAASGFDAERQTVCIGALTKEFRGHPEGSAVITIAEQRGRYVAIVQCQPAAAVRPEARVA